MHTHKYILQPYSGTNSRHTCPACGRHKRFTRYIDTDTGEALAPHAGRCSREVNCGYHFTPRQFFAENPVVQIPRRYTPAPHREQRPSTTYIPNNIFTQSLHGYDTNKLVMWLYQQFGSYAYRLAERYHIGSSNQLPAGRQGWEGATVFWQIDMEGIVRAGKVMLYNATTGRRVKEPYSHITWVHKLVSIDGYELRQSLFGAHLLPLEPHKQVAIVESEKTALIASAYHPECIWLACGSLNNLTPQACHILHGRKVVLYPDLGGYDRWRKKAKQLPANIPTTTSHLLERNATPADRTHGLDLADYLLRISYHEALRTAFLNEFLKHDIPDDMQQQVLNEYLARGLHPADAKSVINELVETWGFVVG